MRLIGRCYCAAANAALLVACLAVAVIVNEWVSGAFPLRSLVENEPAADPDSAESTVRQIDELIRQECQDRQLKPLGPASDLTIARRMTLSLQGRIPSLTEVRLLEQSPKAKRVEAFFDQLFEDQRFGEHLGEVLTQACVIDQVLDPPNPYRRRSFHRWLSNEINSATPYDEIARRIVTAEGLCSEEGAANFYASYKSDPETLAAQASRYFLGLRLDCAQCHDDPFASWKQEQFHQLASYFAGIKQRSWPFDEGDAGWHKHGVYYVPTEYSYKNHKTNQRDTVAPKAPFRPELDSGHGSPRHRLANWLTHRDNPYFARAIVNRMWFLMFGRGLIEPIDDLSKPESVPGVLDILAQDLREHDYDLRRVLRLIARTEAFRRESAMDAPATLEHEEVFASFPVTRLPPKVISFSLSQTLLGRPLGQSTNLIERSLATMQSESFAQGVGTSASDKILLDRPSLVQRLALMNGERWESEKLWRPLTLPFQMALLCGDDELCVRTAFKTCLSRDPTDAELSYFAAELSGCAVADRPDYVADMLWSLTNSSEFIWRH
ncbi:MAG: DUF1549 domain-containing protein [Pirellulales bacterium]